MKRIFHYICRHLGLFFTAIFFLTIEAMADLLQPAMMERVVDGDDYMLYALLNGGAPYLIRDAAYIGVDGDMDDEQRARTENDIERCHTVAAFHERVGMQELVRHEFVDDDPLVQRSVFADGTAVTCDFHTQTYRITDCPHH